MMTRVMLTVALSGIVGSGLSASGDPYPASTVAALMVEPMIQNGRPSRQILALYIIKSDPALSPLVGSVGFESEHSVRIGFSHRAWILSQEIAELKKRLKEIGVDASVHWAEVKGF
ncbi:hypothetical protein CBQ26_17495 [Deinococcus indicus]|uniref:Uncharacterized protein n=1 Tax=Deinococcus indicus TaxID=223556 RepID=A0A246BF76_9DEIO|nr:hypothetical protein [Deinococcus indicus]OWL93875.1 hypothetical protein CBQ26_17495 [Deinococcus indicus]